MGRPIKNKNGEYADPDKVHLECPEYLYLCRAKSYFGATTKDESKVTCKNCLRYMKERDSGQWNAQYYI